jgi:hypothetical protein
MGSDEAPLSAPQRARCNGAQVTTELLLASGRWKAWADNRVGEGGTEPMPRQ